MTKILSLNIRIWTRDLKKSGAHYWKDRYRAIRQYIFSENPAVICLQEVWFPAMWVLRLRSLGYKRTGCGFSHPIYIRQGTKIQKHRTSIYCTTAIVDGVQYFSIHAHWNEKRFHRAIEWFRKKRLQFYDLAHWACIVAGDFNTSDTAKIHDLTALYSAREKLGLTAVDTFRNYTKPESHGEIDHFFYEFLKIYPQTYHVYSGVEDLSDHFPITMIFKTYDKK